MSCMAKLMAKLNKMRKLKLQVHWQHFYSTPITRSVSVVFNSIGLAIKPGPRTSTMSVSYGVFVQLRNKATFNYPNKCTYQHQSFILFLKHYQNSPRLYQFLLNNMHSFTSLITAERICFDFFPREKATIHVQSHFVRLFPKSS